MDAKAKIGLALGGIILAGMVAYVLMPAHSTEDAGPGTQNESAPADLAAAPATEPTTEPVASDPFATPFTSTTLPSDPTVSVNGPDALGAETTAPPTAARDPWGVLDARPAPMPDATAPHNTGFADMAATPLPAMADEPLNTMPRSYTIQSGDSLYKIAQKLYGNSRHMAEIQRANPGLNPSRLKVGQEIKLPDIDGSAVTVARGEQTSPPQSTAARTTARTYKVQSGDSLTKISRKIYGREDMWQKIYQLNRKQIGSDSSRLRAGMTLQLPEQ